MSSTAGVASRSAPERQAAHREPPHECAASRLVRREHCCAVRRHLVQHLAHVARHVYIAAGAAADERVLQQAVILGPLQFLFNQTAKKLKLNFLKKKKKRHLKLCIKNIYPLLNFTSVLRLTSLFSFNLSCTPLQNKFLTLSFYLIRTMYENVQSKKQTCE